MKITRSTTIGNKRKYHHEGKENLPPQQNVTGGTASGQPLSQISNGNIQETPNKARIHQFSSSTSPFTSQLFSSSHEQFHSNFRLKHVINNKLQRDGPTVSTIIDLTKEEDIHPMSSTYQFDITNGTTATAAVDLSNNLNEVRTENNPSIQSVQPLANITNGAIHKSELTTRNVEIGSSSGVKSTAKRCRKRKGTTIEPVIHLDLNTDINSYFTCEYIDLGDPDSKCDHCNANFWFEERVNRRVKTKSKPHYSGCCMNGKVQLPSMPDPPSLYKELLYGDDEKSRLFTSNIRSYNMMFSFTSMGGKIDYSINQGNSPPVFKLYGQNYHKIGSLIPPEGMPPRFAQLYIYDTEHEVHNRMRSLNQDPGTNNLHEEIVGDLKSILDEHNVLVKSFRMARDSMHHNVESNVKLRLIGRRKTDGRCYDLPQKEELALLVVGDFDTLTGDRDLIVETQSRHLQRITEVHPSYLGLQYPLIFLFGQDGFREDILLRDVVADSADGGRFKLSMREFFAYRMHERDDESPNIFFSRRLFQQYLVDTFTMVEAGRLTYIRTNQKKLRCEMYNGLQDALLKGDRDPASRGKRICLPSNYIGGARYMIQNYQDAMAICRWIGYPNLLITFTCNPNSPCMIESRCSKYYPKKFCEHTVVDEDGYAIYKRPDNGRTIVVKGVTLDNRFVVPHNRELLMKHGAHINVEWCNQSKSIKYLCKYVNKSQDMVTAKFCQTVDDGEGKKIVDEIQNYLNCRYIAPCEAAWRLLGNEIHYKNPSVERLSFHLEGQQNIVYNDDDEIEEVVECQTSRESMFTAWMDANAIYGDVAKQLTYAEFPTKFVWNKKERKWKPRSRGYKIGRIFYVAPGQGELYYLRMMLNFVRGPTSFAEIRYVNGEQHESFRDACYALGLLDDDKEYIEGIAEASHWGSAHQVRNLFVTLLMSGSVSRPEHLWESCVDFLSDDIVHIRRRLTGHQGLRLSAEDIKNFTLMEIEKILRNRGKSLKDFPTMPYPEHYDPSILSNGLILDELDYDRDSLAVECKRLLGLCTDEQKYAYDTIMNSVDAGKGGVFFLYGSGGTGKTFLWRILSAALRSKGQIVLNVASSGIASLLLPKGRTGHSRFAIPLVLDEDSTCNIKQGTPLAELMVRTKLIIWDEAPMVHRHCFEALDRTLRDIMRFDNPDSFNLPFGGKTIVFGGDFRQILPVIPNGTRQDIVMATINSSHLWSHCKVLRLTKNMRLKTMENDPSGMELKCFSEWILSIGDGACGDDNDGVSTIKVPNDLLVHSSGDLIKAIVDTTYPSFIDHFDDVEYLQGRAILAPTLDVVESINEYMVSQNLSDSKACLSSDSICRAENNSSLFADIHSVEFLNTIKSSGLPNHHLSLKVGVPVMLLRNIDHSAGLCNGTRLIITRLGEHVLEGKIINGSNTGDKVYIPRMSLTPSNLSLPFKLQRRQFPLIVSYAMTINKSQGQSLTNVGLFLKRPVFSHGQLYVALSRVTNRAGLKILVCDEDGQTVDETINVVYKEIFQNL